MSEAGNYLREAIIAKAKVIGQLSSHPVITGSSREFIVKNLLETFVPRRYEFLSGTIIAKNKNNRQADLMLVDTWEYPTVYREGSIAVCLPDSIRAIIESKSSLENMDQFVDAYFQIITAMQDMFIGTSGTLENPYIPISCLFAFQFTAKTLQKTYQQILAEFNDASGTMNDRQLQRIDELHINELHIDELKEAIQFLKNQKDEYSDLLKPLVGYRHKEKATKEKADKEKATLEKDLLNRLDAMDAHGKIDEKLHWQATEVDVFIACLNQIRSILQSEDILANDLFPRVDTEKLKTLGFGDEIELIQYSASYLNKHIQRYCKPAEIANFCKSLCVPALWPTAILLLNGSTDATERCYIWESLIISENDPKSAKKAYTIHTGDSEKSGQSPFIAFIYHFINHLLQSTTQPPHIDIAKQIQQCYSPPSNKNPAPT